MKINMNHNAMKRLKTSSLMLISLLTFFTCKESIFSEKEPNDSFSTAYSIALDKVTQGSFQSAGDADFYKLIIKEDAVLDITLSPVKGINHAFKIWRGNDTPELIKWVDDNRKSSPERLVNLYVKPGTYFIEVLQSDRDIKKPGRDNPYQLILKSRSAQIEEKEPNDGPEQATQIVPGTEIIGYFSPGFNRLNSSGKFPGREEDWYVMDIKPPSGSPLILQASVSPVAGVNSVLYLFGPDITELAFADNEGIGKGESIYNIGITRPGKYYIVVTTKGGQANNESSYALNVVFKDHDPAREMENNDDFDQANVITKGEITGNMNTAGDRDFFLYKVSDETSVYRIELKPAHEQDLQFTLYNSSKKKTTTVNSEGRGGREVHPDFCIREDFFIEVTAKDRGTQAGDYRLSVSPLIKSPSLESEPNDSRQQANAVTGKEIIGYTSFKGDKDFYMIERSGRAKIQINAAAPRDGDIRLSITDSQGFIIKSAALKGKKKAMLSEMIDGRGYIIVESIREDYDHPYIIQITEKP